MSQPDAVLRRLYEDAHVISGDGTRHDLLPLSIPAREAEALRSWVEREGATATVEVGLAYGLSALAVCAGLRAVPGEGRHVAIDPFQTSYFADLGLLHLREAEVAHLVEFVPEESQVALPRFMEQGRSFDFAFVDGNHRFHSVFLDLAYLGRLVSPGGVIFVDDHQLPAIAHAVNYFVANLDWQIEERSFADDLHEWVVLRTAEDPPPSRSSSSSSSRSRHDRG